MGPKLQKDLIDLASESNGGRTLLASDEFFASKENLLKPGRGEFISDKYISIQARQNFEKFRIGKNFKPKLSIVTRFTIGTINNPINHQGVSFKSLKKGFIESGIVLNQLFYGVGVSGFYRYGPHSFSNIEDNISLKITYVLGFL